MYDYSNYSDYLIFADESGDHGLLSINKQFPIFVLAFCIIHKEEYLTNLYPKIQRLKLDIWGHDQIIFHEHEIRKEKNAFTILRTNQLLREHFYTALNEVINNTDFKIAACIIDKNKLKNKYTYPYNPYELAMHFCMENILQYLLSKEQKNKEIFINFESRGKEEDKNLELEFVNIVNNRAYLGYDYNRKDFRQLLFNCKWVNKQCNSIGLQLADLVARPIGINYLKPAQNNRAYSIIQEYNKLFYYKIFP